MCHAKSCSYACTNTSTDDEPCANQLPEPRTDEVTIPEPVDAAHGAAFAAALGGAVVGTDWCANELTEPRTDASTVARSLGVAYSATKSRPDTRTVAAALIGADEPPDSTEVDADAFAVA